MQIAGKIEPIKEDSYNSERIDLAASFRWSARLGLHEAVSNHFSLAVSEDGKKFLMNPNQKHFSLIKASDMLLLDADNRDTLDIPNAPDATAWGLHGSIHRRCPHARCAMHVHSTYATILASLADSNLPPIDLNTATFFNRYVIDSDLDGLAFESEGERCAAMLQDSKIKVMIMGNHGVMVLGKNAADAFNRLYFFERAAETYIKAKSTGMALRLLSDEIAEKIARDLDAYPGQAQQHLDAIKTILDKEEPDYRD